MIEQQQKPLVVITDSDALSKALYEDLFERSRVDLLFIEHADSLRRLLLGERLPSLVIINFETPNDSFDVYCSLIKRNEQYTHIPVMMITARQDFPVRMLANQYGVDYFLTKPFLLEDLESKVDSVLKADSSRQIASLKSFLQETSDLLPHGVLVANASGDIISGNTQAYDYLGLQKGDEHAAAISSFDLILQKLQLVEGDLSELVNLDDLVFKEWTFVTREGAHRWILVSGKRVFWGNYQRYVLTLKDATEQYRQQSMVWSLRSILNHKLRTPLNGIVAPLGLIKAEPVETTIGQMSGILDIAHRSALRLNSIVERILSYVSVLEHRPGKDVVPLEDVPGCFDQLGHDLGLALKCQPAPLMEGYLMLPRYSLEAILYELLENAQKFHPQGKPFIEVVLGVTDGFLQIRLQDDGKHVAQSALGKLMNPFFQEDPYFTGEIPGAGLGLAQVHRLVALSGGSIEVGNRSDKPGFCVLLSLPMVNDKSIEWKGVSLS